MVTSQKALIKACKILNIDYQIVDKDSTTVRVVCNGNLLYFTHWHKPFNRSDVSRIVKDKALTYEILEGIINIPRWYKYFNPDIADKYSQYILNNENQSILSIERIREDILTRFNLPLIIKPNMGSQGRGVKLCKSDEDILNGIQNIFLEERGKYEYILLAQQYIPFVKEYRVICYKKEIMISYLKDNSEATFQGNLSPLHWKDAFASDCTDNIELNTSFQTFLSPIFTKLNIEYAGFDIGLDSANNLWLIEINGSPGLAHYIKDCGDKRVVEMYSKILQQINITK